VGLPQSKRAGLRLQALFCGNLFRFCAHWQPEASGILPVPAVYWIKFEFQEILRDDFLKWPLAGFGVSLPTSAKQPAMAACGKIDKIHAKT
jgi:hypothetical protein